jgi:hypothetical protein
VKNIRDVMLIQPRPRFLHSIAVLDAVDRNPHAYSRPILSTHRSTLVYRRNFFSTVEARPLGHKNFSLLISKEKTRDSSFERDMSHPSLYL